MASSDERTLDWLFGPVRWDPLNLVADPDDVDKAEAATPDDVDYPRFGTEVPWLPWRVWALTEVWDYSGYLSGLTGTEQALLRNLVEAIAGDDHAGLWPVPKRAIRRALATLRVVRLDLDNLEARLVRTAHASGASWGEIGAALGVSRQTAWTRWRPVIEGTVYLRARGRFGPREHVHALRRSDHTEALCGVRGGVLIDAESWPDLDCNECENLEMRLYDF